METTPIDEEMYSYFAELTVAEKRYFANMIKNFLQKRKADDLELMERHNKHINTNTETGEDFNPEDASELSNGWLHGK